MTRPYTIAQRPDGLWTAYDAAGCEVPGIASPCRENAENFVAAAAEMGAEASGEDGGTYVHVLPK